MQTDLGDKSKSNTAELSFLARPWEGGEIMVERIETRKQTEIQAVAQKLMETFAGRKDYFAVQLKDGRYFCKKDELTTTHIVRHLKGTITLGVYLLGKDGTAKYAVIDADDEEGLEKMKVAQSNLLFPSYLETSRRGGHLWFFFEQPVAGKVAKNFGLEIAKRFAINAEVFPKQAESNGPGSCIRLPFGIHQKTGKRYPFVGIGGLREQIIELSNPKRIPLSEVMKYQYQELQRKVLPKNPLNGELPLWEKVKRQITVLELVENYVDLNSKGVGKCPFHNDKHPSFSVNVKENYWHCFSGCGGGSVIDFWMKLNNMDFQMAVKDLAERLGVR